MKKIRYILLMTLAAAVCACSDSAESSFLTENSFIKVPESVSVGGNKSDQATMVIEAGCDWTIEGVPSWLVVEPAHGSGNATVTFTADEANSSSQTEREPVVIYVKAGSIRQAVSVTQRPGAGFLVFGDGAESVDISCVAQTRSYQVICNGSWKITPSTGMTVSPTSGTGNSSVDVTFAFNNNPQPHTMPLLLESKDVTRTVNFVQAGYEPSLQVESTYFPADTIYKFVLPKIGGTVTFDVSCGDNWKIRYLPSWATVDKDHSTETGLKATVMLTVAENQTTKSRSAVFQVYNSDYPEQVPPVSITIEQSQNDSQLTLEDTPAEISTAPMAGSTKVRLRSSDPVHYRIDADWIEVTPGAVSGNVYEYDLKWTANVADSRTGVVAFVNDMRDVVMVKVMQRHISLLESPSMSLGNAAASSTLSLPAGVQCTVSSDAAWCKASVSGTTLTIAADANLTPAERTATVEVSVPGYSETLTVTQAATSLAEVRITGITDITNRSCTVSGSYSSESAVTETGVIIYDKATSRPVNAPARRVASSRADGTFSYVLSDLQPAHTYTVVAYAVNAAGHAYSESMEVTTDRGTIPGEDDNDSPSVD